MQILDVESVLERNDAARPLNLAPPDALNPNRELYTVVLLQPHGRLQATIKRIGHADQTGAAQMCTRFLDLATETQADLVVAPEYCAPWTVVDKIISGSLRPRVGAIWALGCESITPDELRKRAVGLPADLRLIHEPLDARQEAQKHFIDPLVYVFWTTDEFSHQILCLLVQFKTEPCKDEGHIELTALYLGKWVYAFNRNINKISLVGIICSDAFCFTNSLVDQYHKNSLILHIQLNPKPAHPDYSAYRARLFSVGSDSHNEVLCLNWARDVMEVLADRSEKCWDNVAGSAWYLAPKEFAGEDNAIDTLHRQGAYHSFILPTRWHALYLNHAPAVFVLRKQKVFNDGPQALIQPIGAELVEVRKWDATTASWVTSAPNDGFPNVLTDYPNLTGQLAQLCTQSPLAVERALELLVGPEGSPDNWFAIRELRALRVESDESIRCVTVHQENVATRSGVVFRRSRLRRAEAAATLAGQAVSWPPAAKDLASGFQFSWNSDRPHRNVSPSVGSEGPATLVFLGEEPENEAIQAAYQKLAQALRSHAVARGLDDSEITRCKDRLCVVFRRNHTIQVYRPKGAASFTEPGGGSPVDVTGGGGE